MKHLTLITFLLMLAGITQAQKLEVNVYAGTGLYNYTGTGSNTDPNTAFGGYNSDNYYITNPYNHRLSFSYEAGLQVKWVSASGFLFGLRTGYEVLRSSRNVDRAYNVSILAASSSNYLTLIAAYQNGVPATGSYTLTNQYININPFVGYRFRLGKISLDGCQV